MKPDFPMALVPAVAAALCACLSDTTPPGDVGSETHFLSACVGNDQCRDGLVCLCGICTSPCEDACALGGCATGDSPAVRSWCGGALDGGICLATCETPAECGQGACDAGFCAAGPRPDGTPCEGDAQCEGGQCTLGFCGEPCMIPDDLCGPDAFCMVPGAASGVCLPGVIEAFPAAIDGGAIAVGTTHELELTLANRTERPLEIIRIQVESRDLRAPTEVGVTPAPPLALEVQAPTVVRVRMAPDGAGPRAYRLVIRVAGSAQALVVDVDFSGVAP